MQAQMWEQRDSARVRACDAGWDTVVETHALRSRLGIQAIDKILTVPEGTVVRNTK